MDIQLNGGAGSSKKRPRRIATSVKFSKTRLTWWCLGSDSSRSPC